MYFWNNSLRHGGTGPPVTERQLLRDLAMDTSTRRKCKSSPFVSIKGIVARWPEGPFHTSLGQRPGAWNCGLIARWPEGPFHTSLGQRPRKTSTFVRMSAGPARALPCCAVSGSGSCHQSSPRARDARVSSQYDFSADDMSFAMIYHNNHI